MSGFISKPVSGWIHSDTLISKQGATYSVKYIGCLEVQVSMKVLDFKTRSNVAKLCISRVCEAAGLKTADKKRRIDKKVAKAIADVPKMDYAGTDVSLNISSTSLTLTCFDTKKVIASHDMPRISFASGGDLDTLDFVAYIAKDPNGWRACYVIECVGGLAKDVISTIGQAFELRYKQYMKPNMPIESELAARCDIDKDYYNDLPGKVPPDFGPPPVPPLPTVVSSLNTLPQIAPHSPNLIDFSTELSSRNESFLPEPHHDYVNCNNKERDVFDMQPFNQLPNEGAAMSIPMPIPNKKMTTEQFAELQNELWFHGIINRSEAERRLLKDGDFLVRESSNSQKQFVLSGMQGNTKKHLLLIDPEGVVRTKDRMFQSVSHLINYHCENALPIISAESALVLRTPVIAPHRL